MLLFGWLNNQAQSYCHNLIVLSTVVHQTSLKLCNQQLKVISNTLVNFRVIDVQTDRIYELQSCTPSSLGPAALGIRVYISGRTLVPVLQLLNILLKMP